MTTDYTCTHCATTWQHDRRRGTPATRCPQGCDPSHLHEVRTCEVCGQTFQRALTRGQAPRSCAECRSPGGRRLRPVPCWVCGTVTAAHDGTSDRRRRVCSERCKTTVRAGLGSKPTRRAFEEAVALAARPQPRPHGIAADVTPLELGWLVGVIETDGAIYATKRATAHRPRRPPVVVLEVENADQAMMQRVARLIGAREPKRRDQVANAAGNWTKPTFRVELQSRRAEAIYHRLLPHFMPITTERVERAFARAGRSLEDPPGPPSPQPEPA